MQPDNALNWFEIPVTDFDRAKAFYESILEFQMPVTTMDKATMGFLLYDFKNQKVGGAIVHDPEFLQPSASGTLVYLNCNPDLQMVLERVEKAGGKILNQKELISEEQNLGFWALILDTEGNRLGLHSMH